jgi:hypothetical protein
MTTLPVFSVNEKGLAKRLLASRVAQMMGRKFEEGDWSAVYCRAKGIPDQGWSNLHIDVVHDGLGVEHKMLCVGENKSLMSFAGTTLMHPAATRSIRIASTEIEASDAMRDVLEQYRRLIEQRTARVAEAAGKGAADMRTGWLIWERSLTEFLYFEERMAGPDYRDYWAEWHETPARGVRKPSKNLWIYDKATNKKRYSVTTTAGAKIQPYFDVPAPNDPNLLFFRVQGEEIAPGRVLIWVNASTARELHLLLEKLKQSNVSDAIIKASDVAAAAEAGEGIEDDLAQAIEVTTDAYAMLVAKWGGVSDEHRAQLLIQTLRGLIG